MSGTNGGHPGRIIRQPAPVPLEVLQQQFTAIRDANQVKLAELERSGLAMNPVSFLHARIDKLIESISRFAGPDGQRWEVLARLSFEQHVAAELAAAEDQGRKMQLSQGGAWTPGMIAELARQTGLFRRAS